ncbi:MAG: hypothetical protein JWO21_321, partial [Solirubrobacterales bacterium]|nr:hypothetical protein [Solirubrobacterales bacterium]
VRLDFVDRRKNLPRHPILHRRSLIDRQQEQRNPVEAKRLHRRGRRRQRRRQRPRLTRSQLRRHSHIVQTSHRRRRTRPDRARLDGTGFQRAGLDCTGRRATGARRRGPAARLRRARGRALPALEHDRRRVRRRGSGGRRGSGSRNCCGRRWRRRWRGGRARGDRRSIRSRRRGRRCRGLARRWRWRAGRRGGAHWARGAVGWRGRACGRGGRDCAGERAQADGDCQDRDHDRQQRAGGPRPSSPQSGHVPSWITVRSSHGFGGRRSQRSRRDWATRPYRHTARDAKVLRGRSALDDQRRRAKNGPTQAFRSDGRSWTRTRDLFLIREAL